MTTISWAAGVFEGEGYIRDVRQRPKAELSVAMCDLDVIQALHSLLGVGTISGPQRRTRNPAHTPIWVWCVTGKQRVAAVLTQMLPYFGSRRAFHALNCLDYIDGI